ncbi:MAG: hypothetical protein ACQSGP_30370 [Frankia sp.]
MTVFAAAVAVISTAGTASAHTVSGGAGASDYRTSVTSFTPTVAGLTLTVVENGSRLQLTNATRTDVIVLGYQGEPYLRVGPDGVFTNERSTATYLNETRSGGAAVPATADDQAPPVWRRTAAAPRAGMAATVVWHDHRTHWMSPDRPPIVAANPGAHHRIFTWQVSFRYGAQAVTARGDLDWVPGPAPTPWVALALGAAALTIALAVGRRTFRPSLAAVLLVLVAADVAHSVGIAADRAGSSSARWHGFLTGNSLQLVAWTAGVLAVIALARRRINALWVAGMVGAVLALADGLPDAGVLYRSSAPFAWPLSVARALTAITVGLGFGLLAAVALALRRHDRPERHPEPVASVPVAP